LIGIRISDAVESVDREYEKSHEDAVKETSPTSIKGLILGLRRMFERGESHRIIKETIPKEWKR
jgi:hypothetical protein